MKVICTFHMYELPHWSFLNTDIIENALKKCLPTYNLRLYAVFSLQMSTAVEIYTILATANVTKISDF